MILAIGDCSQRRGRGLVADALFAVLAIGAAFVPAAFAESISPNPTRSAGLADMASWTEGGQVVSQTIDPSGLPLATPLAEGAWRVTRAFGPGVDPLSGMSHMHTGLDLSDYRKGDPVRSTMDGTVVLATYDADYGYYVIVRRGEIATLYAHLDRIAVAEGARLSAGELLGYVGRSGRSTGPHLHYEVRMGGSFIDPLPLLAAGGAGYAKK